MDVEEPPIPAHFIESLQLQALQLVVRALVDTNPNPAQCEAALRDLFAQFQASAAFLSMPPPHRDFMRRIFDLWLR